MQRLSVLFPAPLDCYDYQSGETCPAGTFVQAPWGRQERLGVVWDKPPDKRLDPQKIKTLSGILPIPPLPRETIDFVNWVARYTLTPLGAVLKMALIPDVEKVSARPLAFPTPQPDHQRLTFSPAQQQAVSALADAHDFRVFLLDGITGSGKTEVYFESIARALQDGKQALVLLPEITLTTLWLGRFEKRFGVKPAVWHSAMTPKQRRDTWQAVRSGQAAVVVGARSALFLPFAALGLIVVDEEHDSSFKQEEGVLYHARDMAVVRAKLAACPIILSSATPALETYCHALSGKYAHITLPERFAGALFPQVRLADMRQKEKGKVCFLAPMLKQLLAENLEKREQSLLFLNRRGYAPLVLCRACGERLKCPHCAAWLVEHKKKKNLQCHHCGYTRALPPLCPSCQAADSFISCGPGVERIEEEIKEAFAHARCAVITSDTLARPDVFQELATQIENQEIDILIGTQMLAKGHHFANLTLVGVIDADMGLEGGDLRAGERTFQLLHQVMGRAGRAQKAGVAVLQTYAPDNAIIQALAHNDRARFMDAEIKMRQALGMPPFGRLAAVIITARQEKKALQTAMQLAQKAPLTPHISVLGPVAAPLAYLRGKYRFRLLIKADAGIPLQAFLTRWLAQVPIPAAVSVRLDVDPYSFF